MAVDGQLETQNRAGSLCTHLLPSIQTSAFSAATDTCNTEKRSQNCRCQEVGKSQWVEMNSGAPSRGFQAGRDYRTHTTGVD